jgi:PilZ domain-containing protein
MSTATVPLPRRASNLATRVAPDRRRHKRFPLPMLGRFMRANKQEYPCKLRDISVGGVALMSPVDVEAGERIVAYFDQFGGIEGTVARTFEGGFAIRLTVTQHKREKLAAQITWLINRHELSSAEDRRHERIPIGSKLTSLKLAEGIVVDVRVIDISLSGASIATTARPALGAELLLGKHRIRVMRHHDNGIGVQFIDIQEPEALRRYFD